MTRTFTTASSAEGRRRALAELDAEIERAECTRTRYLVHVEELTTAGADTSGAEALLRQADDHLVRLRESRAVLVADGRARSWTRTSGERKPPKKGARFPPARPL